MRAPSAVSKAHHLPISRASLVTYSDRHDPRRGVKKIDPCIGSMAEKMTPKNRGYNSGVEATKEKTTSSNFNQYLKRAAEMRQHQNGTKHNQTSWSLIMSKRSITNYLRNSNERKTSTVRSINYDYGFCSIVTTMATPMPIASLLKKQQQRRLYTHPTNRKAGSV